MKQGRINQLNITKIKEIADILGAPYRTIQDWDSGTQKPLEWIEKIIIENI